MLGIGSTGALNAQPQAPPPALKPVRPGKAPPNPYSKIGPGDIGLIGPTFTSFKLPFGVTYSMNLTPDVETGSGGWTEEKFLKIFRTARHPDGRVLLPPVSASSSPSRS